MKTLSDPIPCAVMRQPSIQAVRRVAHHVAVLERAGLRLVRVDDEVDGLAGVLREERRLAAHREPCPATAAQRRGGDLVHDRLRLQRARLLERLVAADRAVLVEPREVAILGPGREQASGYSRPRSSSTSRARPPARTGSW